MNVFFKWCLGGIMLFASCSGFAQTASTWFLGPADCHQHWGVLAYYARMTDRVMHQVLRFNISFARANIVAYELDRELACDNPIRRFLQPIVHQVNVAMNIAVQDDPNGPMFAVNPFLLLTWQYSLFPKTLITTFSIGEGVSYITGHPARETRDTERASNDRRFLNFLVVELTAASPEYPDWQLVYRIHHRSGVFGLYSPGIVGSTAVGLGIRHRFQ